MKSIILKQLSLRNFKGIKELTLQFTKQTDILGANEAGKTTIFDAFNWLLFGKDSFDRKDFAIKNTVFPELNRQEHEVEGLLVINDEPVSIKRIYKEKWTKKKGATRSEHTGNEQEFYWNDVPMQAGQFANKIAEVVDETVFKLITNALYFNLLPWKKRREFLFKLAGEISDNDVAATNNKFKDLVAIISSKSLDGYKAEINAKKKKFKDDLEAIPFRIDEVSRSLPEQRDFAALKVKKSKLESSIADIDTLISDKNKASQNHLNNVQEKQHSIHKLKTEINDLRFTAESTFKKSLNTLSTRRSEIADAVSNIERNLRSKSILMDSQRDTKKGLDLRRNNLRELFETTNSKEIEFDANQFACPTCKRAFEAQVIEEGKVQLRKNFMADKNKALDEIEAKGIALKKESEECEKMISQLATMIDGLHEELKDAKASLEKFEAENTNVNTVFDANVFFSSENYIALNTKLTNAQSELDNMQQPAENNTSELKDRKLLVSSELDLIKREINLEEQIKSGHQRIEDLKAQETNLSGQLAELEGEEHNIEEFTKAKIELIEKRINGKFQFVKFKMYDYTIDNNPIETCETMYKDVPFSDLNTAGKIWAGIDIINTLSTHYQVFAPIFLDNRESISMIPATDSQVVNLIVSPEDKQLRVA
ncbi:AAA family ATPase [Pedobacter sp. Leaf132]|uniref:AAA family ATPase n=1 Tax=Pedobacter sp. Leaf132 TaxID=2876557 RepID=UPI001E2DBCA6|nr:AAA family ATPase [Pedobacter sp. Leaf132]